MVNGCERRVLAREMQIGKFEMSSGYSSGTADE